MDVAKRAEVSKATVSAVLNDKASVRDSTRERVVEAMQELNYRPSPAARRRVRAEAGKSVGLVIKELDNPYYMEVASGVKDHADEHGYTVLIATSEGSYDSERRVVELLKAQETGGMIILPVMDGETDLSHLFALKRRNYPFVLLEEIQGVQANHVDVDNVDASRRATRHLIEQGHERVVHFAGPEYSHHTQERIDGVRRAFAETPLAFGDDMVVPTGAHFENGYEAALEHFERTTPEHATAVTCFNDLVALGVMKAVEELGLGVPEDVSVVGYDGLSLLRDLSIPLTTVEIPKYEMGRVATEILIRHIESTVALRPEKVYLKAEFTDRGTTAPPRGSG